MTACAPAARHWHVPSAPLGMFRYTKRMGMAHRVLIRALPLLGCSLDHHQDTSELAASPAVQGPWHARQGECKLHMLTAQRTQGENAHTLPP